VDKFGGTEPADGNTFFCGNDNTNFSFVQSSLYTRES
jgi:hypothetical protein